MKELKFVHCADIHMDMPFTSLDASGEKSSVRRADLKEAFARIINMVKEEKADMLLISGDLYEHEYVRKSTVNYINDLFKEIQPAKVFIAPGNHDPYIPNSYYKNFKWAENVYILTENSPYDFLEDLGACIHGVSFKNFYEDESLISDMKPADSQHINILVVHGTVDMPVGQAFKKHNPMTTEDLRKLGMDYIALGHFHNRLETASANVYNPGSPEPLGFDEPGDHGAFVGTIRAGADGKHSDVRFVKLNKRFYENVEVNIEGCTTDEGAAGKVLGSISISGMNNGLYNITLKGCPESGFKINAAQVQAYLEDKFFFVKINDETSAGYSLEEIMNEPGLKGLFARKVSALMEKSRDDKERRQLLKAFYYGMEALEQGNIDI